MRRSRTRDPPGMEGEEGADGLPEIVVSTKGYVAEAQNFPL